MTAFEAVKWPHGLLPEKLGDAPPRRRRSVETAHLDEAKLVRALADWWKNAERPAWYTPVTAAAPVTAAPVTAAPVTAAPVTAAQLDALKAAFAKSVEDTKKALGEHEKACAAKLPSEDERKALNDTIGSLNESLSAIQGHMSKAHSATSSVNTDEIKDALNTIVNAKHTELLKQVQGIQAQVQEAAEKASSAAVDTLAAHAAELNGVKQKVSTLEALGKSFSKTIESLTSGLKPAAEAAPVQAAAAVEGEGLIGGLLHVASDVFAGAKQALDAVRPPRNKRVVKPEVVDVKPAAAVQPAAAVKPAAEAGEIARTLLRRQNIPKEAPVTAAAVEARPVRIRKPVDRYDPSSGKNGKTTKTGASFVGETQDADEVEQDQDASSSSSSSSEEDGEGEAEEGESEKGEAEEGESEEGEAEEGESEEGESEEGEAEEGEAEKGEEEEDKDRPKQNTTKQASQFFYVQPKKTTHSPEQLYDALLSAKDCLDPQLHHDVNEGEKTKLLSLIESIFQLPDGSLLRCEEPHARLLSACEFLEGIITSSEEALSTEGLMGSESVQVVVAQKLTTPTQSVPQSSAQEPSLADSKAIEVVVSSE